MSEPLEWVPERFSRAGGLAAAGFKKLLGRPKLDPLSVLVRETAQNSWDARASDSPVLFWIDVWSEIDASELKALRDVVFPNVPKQLVNLRQGLSSKMGAIYVCDRGTKGLGGPLSADLVDPHDVYDWVDFILNVGKPNVHGETGGTYGFGKTISYVVSSVSTIVVHSRTMVGKRSESRLIACAIGDQFTKSGFLHTGRHWWGRVDDGAPMPVRGVQADKIARAIGMPGIDDGELGTTIMILAPELGGRSPQQAARFLAESVTWHLWPKLIARGPKRRMPMDISVRCDGSAVEIPNPTERPPLQGFVQAFKAILEGQPRNRQTNGLEVKEIRCLRPNTNLGDLAMIPMVYRERPSIDDGSGSSDDARPAAMIQGPSHHVALLREPELVVEYREGPAPVAAGTEWAAVFRSKRAEDASFAAAEPPTHDTWNPDLLPRGQAKTKVNVALREIDKALRQRWAPVVESSPLGLTSTAAIANQLGTLMRALDGAGPGERDDSSGGGGGGGGDGRRRVLPRAVVERVGAALVDGSPGTRATIRVENPDKAEELKVEVSIAVALDDGASDTALDPLLRLIRALLPDGSEQELAGARGIVRVSTSGPLTFDVLVARSRDTAVEIGVELT